MNLNWFWLNRYILIIRWMIFIYISVCIYIFFFSVIRDHRKHFSQIGRPEWCLPQSYVLWLFFLYLFCFNLLFQLSLLFSVHFIDYFMFAFTNSNKILWYYLCLIHCSWWLLSISIVHFNVKRIRKKKSVTCEQCFNIR